MKIEIKSIFGSILFEYDVEDNSLRKTLEKAINSSADLSSADLISADLISADLSSADLSSADLSYADLSYADLSYADLSSADLSYANLSSAYLSSANLSSANLSSANLSSADLSSANLQQIKGKKFAQISFSGHGENSRQLSAIYEKENIILFCGCFKGTKEELIVYIEKGDEKYKLSRTLAMETVLKLIEI